MTCVSQFNNAILSGFYHYGYLVGKYPICFMAGCVVICSGLAFGIMFLDPLTDIELLYAPQDSQAYKDRDAFEATFPDVSATNFHSYALSRENQALFIIFRSRKGEDILDPDTMTAIQTFLAQVQAINVTVEGTVYTYDQLCARRNGECVFLGEYLFTDRFRHLLDARRLTYPFSNHFPTEDLAASIGRPNVTTWGPTHNTLIAAGSLLFWLPMRADDNSTACRAWVDDAVVFLKEFNTNTSIPFDVAFSSRDAIEEEVHKSTASGPQYFLMTFALMIGYATCVSSGGNMVSTRAILSLGGVLGIGLGIISSLGLVTLAGVRYVDQVGIMPYLLLGVGVDDMFLLMSAWSESTARQNLTIPDRMGRVFKKAGVGITITSVTTCLSFVIGSTASFKSVKNFCIYTGAGIIMCYLTNISFFGGCMTLHGRRISAKRHTLTCRRVTSADKDVGQLHWMLCGGSVPERAIDDQSICEKGPSAVLPRLIMWKPTRVVIIILFVTNLGFATWGLLKLKRGFDPADLVLTTSFIRKFQEWQKDYGLRLGVSFVTTTLLNYSDFRIVKEMRTLLKTVGRNRWMSGRVQVCWLTSYADSPLYQNVTHGAFMAGLQTFLGAAKVFDGDVIIENDTVIASRCHVFTKSISETYKQAEMMESVREIAKESKVVDFAYSQAFIFFESYLTVFPTTIYTVGITVVVMAVVTAFFLPHPLIVLIVLVQVVMIVVCIFGYMALWDLNLSSITMIHLIMSAGFSVDFCAHVCTAYMVSGKVTREGKAAHAIIHASGPILNGGTSSIVGICGLLLSESYIFQSFFKVMFLVIAFGLVHAVFFVPVILSFIGPTNYVDSSEDGDSTAHYRSSEDVNAIRQGDSKSRELVVYHKSGENLDVYIRKMDERSSKSRGGTPTMISPKFPFKYKETAV